MLVLANPTEPPKSPRLAMMNTATPGAVDLRSIMLAAAAAAQQQQQIDQLQQPADLPEPHFQQYHQEHFQQMHQQPAHVHQTRGSSSSSSSGGKKRHACHWTGCDHGFELVTALGKHILDTHINCYASSDPLSTTCQWAGCPRLGKAFSTKMKLIMHVRAHTGEKPYACSVPGCAKKFSRMDILNKHLKSHANSSTHVCIIHGCGKVFTDAASLARHKESHPASKPYVCPVDGCGKRYTDGSGLYKHTEQCHQNDAAVRQQVALRVSSGSEELASRPGVQSASSSRRAQQPLQRLLLQQHFQEFEHEGEDSDASQAAGSDLEANDLSDYDDADSPTRKGPRRVSADDTTRAPMTTPHTAMAGILATSSSSSSSSSSMMMFPPSSTGNTFSLAAFAPSQHTPAFHQHQVTFRAAGPSAAGPDASLKRRSAEMEDSYPMVVDGGSANYLSPLRYSPSLHAPLSHFALSDARPAKLPRSMRNSRSEPNLNLKALAEDDETPGPTAPSAPLKREEQGAIDLLLYFSSHPQQQQQSSSGATSPTHSHNSTPTRTPSQSPLPAAGSAPSPTDLLRLPSIASLRLNSPVVGHVDPRFNSFTGLSAFPQHQAPPTMPSHVPISPSSAEGPTLAGNGAFPPLPALPVAPYLPAVGGGSFTFTKPMFADRVVKASKSAPNLSSEAASQQLSFLVTHPDLFAHAGMGQQQQQQQQQQRGK